MIIHQKASYFSGIRTQERPHWPHWPPVRATRSVKLFVLDSHHFEGGATRSAAVVTLIDAEDRHRHTDHCLPSGPVHHEKGVERITYRSPCYSLQHLHLQRNNFKKSQCCELLFKRCNTLLNVRLFIFRLSNPQHHIPGIQHDTNEKNDEGSGHQIHTPIRLFDQECPSDNPE